MGVVQFDDLGSINFFIICLKQCFTNEVVLRTLCTNGVLQPCWTSTQIPLSMPMPCQRSSSIQKEFQFFFKSNIFLDYIYTGISSLDNPLFNHMFHCTILYITVGKALQQITSCSSSNLNPPPYIRIQSESSILQKDSCSSILNPSSYSRIPTLPLLLCIELPRVGLLPS